MINITGSLTELTGLSDVSGTVIFQLQGFGNWLPTVPGTGLLATISTTAILAGGTFATSLFGNDKISPAGTYYLVTIISDSGAQLASVPYQFTGTASVDLSSASPMITAPTDISPISLIDCQASGFTIQHKRGTYASMPALANAELYFATDTSQLFMGFNGINVQVGGVFPTFAIGEIPGGTPNGVLTTFTLAYPPNPPTSFAFYLNGLRQFGGFSVAGTTLTLTTAPLIGDELNADYRH